MLSVLDIFRIGIGPSSSHTVGPMRIAAMFAHGLKRSGKLAQTVRVAVELQGSLALTGVGHGTVSATILGLMGHRPDRLDPDEGLAALYSGWDSPLGPWRVLLDQTLLPS